MDVQRLILLGPGITAAESDKRPQETRLPPRSVQRHARNYPQLLPYSPKRSAQLPQNRVPGRRVERLRKVQNILLYQQLHDVHIIYSRLYLARCRQQLQEIPQPTKFKECFCLRSNDSQEKPSSSPSRSWMDFAQLKNDCR